MIENPLDIVKRLDVKQNVTIRIIDEPTGKVVQEHVGHNSATNSLLTGIAHYLMGDGVFNQGGDILSAWVPQYISLGTMGLVSQDADEDYLPIGIGTTPLAPSGATATEQELNTVLRYTEYVNQTPGFGADGYSDNINNDREWFGLGLPYSDKPAKVEQYFGDAGSDTYTLSSPVLDKAASNIVSIIVYPDGVINQDMHDTSINRVGISASNYSLDASGTKVTITDGTSYSGRIAIQYKVESSEAVNCELIKTSTLRSKITYRNIIPEVQAEIPNTLDVIYSAFISTGALKEYRGDNDYVYITEAGLWSRSYYDTSGDNGLLAGYRILPTDDEIYDVRLEQSFVGDGVTTTFELDEDVNEILSVTVSGEQVIAYDLIDNNIVFSEAPEASAPIVVTYTTTSTEYTWKDMTKEENRQKVQQSILRIGKNQVAQVIWKLQLGGLQQLNGLRYIYPSQYPEEVWNIWSSH